MGVNDGLTAQSKAHINEAEEFIRSAEKKLKPSWFFSLSSSDKYEDAAELYKDAAKKFKVAKQWSRAGETFNKSAELYEQADCKYDASRQYGEAANCFKNCDPEATFNAVDNANRLDSVSNSTAERCKMKAEIYEKLDQKAQACNEYKGAADLYNANDSLSKSNGCQLKVGQLLAELGQYQDACEAFEKVANSVVNNELLKYSTKEYFLKAGLCRLCTGDIVHAREQLEEYTKKDLSFETTREYTLLEKILASLESREVGEFTDAVAEYDRLTRLDSWKTNILLVIKKQVEGFDGDDGDDGDDDDLR